MGNDIFSHIEELAAMPYSYYSLRLEYHHQKPIDYNAQGLKRLGVRKLILKANYMVYMPQMIAILDDKMLPSYEKLDLIMEISGDRTVASSGDDHYVQALLKIRGKENI